MSVFCRLAVLCWLLLTTGFQALSAQEPGPGYYTGLADSLAEAKEFAAAVRAQMEAIRLMEGERAPNYEELVRSHLSIAKYFRREGRLDSAFFYIQLAREKGERHLAPDDYTLSDVYNAFGIYYYIQGNCQEALRYYNIALERRLKRGGRWTARVADAYNNMAICYDVLELRKEAIAHYEEALAIRLRLFDECSPQVAESYLNIGVGYHYLPDYNQALHYYEKALEIWQETLPPNHPDFALIYNNMGVCYQNKGDYRRAQFTLERSLQHNIDVHGSEHFEVANAYNNLGLNFYAQGDFNKALVYFERALSIRQKNFEESHPLIASLYNNIGNCFRFGKNYEKALHYLRKGLDIRLEVFGPVHREVVDSYNDLGLYFEAVGDYFQALVHYRRALEAGDKTGESYLRMGRCYFQFHDMERARSYFTSALQRKKEMLGDRHPEVAEAYTELARCYPDEPAKGLAYVERALAELRFDRSGRANQLQTPAPLHVLSALNVEGSLHFAQYKLADEEASLEKAYASFLSARRVIELTRRSYQEPGSKQRLLDQFFDIFQHSIEINLALYACRGEVQYLEEALLISENSKNVLLNEAIQKAQTSQHAGVPEEWAQREADLLLDIGFYEGRLFSEEQRGSRADPGIIEMYRERVFERKSAYYSLLDTLSRSYPSYYALRYGRADFSLAALQARLAPEKETLVAYFLGDERLFVFVVNPDTIAVFEREGVNILAAQVRHLRGLIAAFDPIAIDPAQPRLAYSLTAHQLYQWLLAPAVPLFQSDNLIIVPDGFLGYLPFEGLLTYMPDADASWKNFPYLIRDFQVSYQYAAAWLTAERRSSSLSQGARVLAMAPGFSDRGVYRPLRYNQEEVSILRKRLPGTYLLGRRASAERFLKLAPKFRVIHLATHAQASDAHPYLAFSKGKKIYLHDLYNLSLEADMVVLSACETGVGEWQRGEGVVSLGRGFLYAGAGSVVSTLWSVDDQPSAKIMDAFYARLQEGFPKDKALRLAKLQYLEQHSALRAHPLFWAGFTPLGDMTPVAFQEKTAWWVWFILFSVCALLALVVYLRQRPSAGNGA